MGVALRPVADDRDGLPCERGRIRVIVVIHGCGHWSPASCRD
jgi:hypothetical protein